MTTRQKTFTAANGVHDAVGGATNNVVYLSGGTCEIRTVVSFNGANYNGEWQQLAADKPVFFNLRFDKLEIRNMNGNGTILLEAYNV